MNRILSWFFLLTCLIQGLQLRGQDLISETMLHPGDGFTAYTLKKGEWAYNQAITPYPSWAWWGISNTITAELDLEAWLGGVPSFNFRFALIKEKGWGPSLAYETMFQHLREDFEQFENVDGLSVVRTGSSWYNRLNASWKVGRKLYIHASVGATCAEHIRIGQGHEQDISTEYDHLISPDFSLSLDCRMSKLLSSHLTYNYGSTFLYADNIPRKEQLSIAFRAAPFITSTIGFLRVLRFELAWIDAYFPDAQKGISGPIGFLYWQWMWKK